MELWEFTGRVALALTLGTLIGLERQFTHHPAGLRTNALVSVGAALFVVLSHMMGDPSGTRIAANIVVGIGFLGGGAILKEGMNIRGLTTGAALWCSAAVGTLAGVGFGAHAVIGTAAVLIVLGLFHPIDDWIKKLRHRLIPRKTRYRVRVICDKEQHDGVQAAIARLVDSHAKLTVSAIAVRKHKTRNRMRIVAELSTTTATEGTAQAIVNHILGEPGVTTVNCEQLAVDTE